MGGGATEWWGGGHVKLNPYKMGCGKSFRHAEGQRTKRFAVVLMRDP